MYDSHDQQLAMQQNAAGFLHFGKAEYLAMYEEQSKILDPTTVGRQLFGLSYPGPSNPMTYPDLYGNRTPVYSVAPKSLAEYPAIGHDRRYDNLKISGFLGLVSDTRAIGADWQFVGEEFDIALTSYLDPVTRMQAAFFGTVLGGVSLGKTIIGLGTQSSGEIGMWYGISTYGVTNAPTPK